MVVDGPLQQWTNLSLLLLLLPGAAAQLTPKQEIGLIVGCAVGGVILLIVVVVLIVVCCCKSTKTDDELRKKGRYLEFRDPTTVYTNPKPRVDQPKVNGYVQGGGKLPRLERSRSDAVDNRPSAARPEWRRQQDKRDKNSHGNGFVDTGSELPVPAGIWTSNPTLTQGLYPSYAVMNIRAPNGVPNGKPSSMFGSEPALNAHRQSSKNRQKAKHGRGSKNLAPVQEDNPMPLTVDTTIWDRSKSSHSSNKRNVTKVKEDTKELLPGSSSEDTSSEKEQQLVARAYSNPGFKREPPVIPSKTPGQDGPFVAKVYSDYQLPKDYIPDSRHKPSGNGQVAKMFSSYSGDEVGRRHEFTRTEHQNNGHVAKVLVRQSSSYDSGGEPKYAQPQDAYKVTNSDWILYSQKNKQVGRTQSNMERSRPQGAVYYNKHGHQQRPVSQGNNNRAGNKRSTQVIVDSATDVRGPFRNPYGKGVYMRQSSDHVASQTLPMPNKEKLVKNKSRKTDTSTPPKKKNSDIQKKSKLDNSREGKKLAVDIHAARAVAQVRHDKPMELPPVHGYQANGISKSAVPIHQPSSPISVSSSVGSPIKRGSQLEHFAAPEDPSAIYSAVNRESRPISQVELPTEMTPLSPEPPPVPPVTKLRDEAVSPDPPRPSEDGHRQRLKSVNSDGDGISTGKSVIGDAFRFLEEFEDNASLDGELDRL